MSSQPAQEKSEEPNGEACEVQTDDLHIDKKLKSIIADVLGLNQDDVAEFAPETGLFGHLPELDSMAVAGLLTEMEDRLDIYIDDDDIDGEMLETYGGLLAFAEAKTRDS